ncbi:MAG: thiamine-phosphate kinase [Planctomycetota bacterium]
MNEIDWVERLTERFAIPATETSLGIGDDACVLTLSSHESLVTTVDSLVEGVHFRAEWFEGAPFTIDQLAERAILISVSDLSAMAAEPRGVLLALETPSLDRVDDRFFDGVERAVSRGAGPLLGGNVTRTSGPLSISVTALGAIPRGQALRRDTARPGDELWVTGQPGRARSGLHALLEAQSASDLAAIDRDVLTPWVAPPLLTQVARELVVRDRATAGLDLSDGLALDLSRLLSASDVGARVELTGLEERSGIQAEEILEGGEDYELLVTVRPEESAAIGAQPDRWTKIGEITESRKVTIASKSGPIDPGLRGWDPFRGH